MPRRCGGLPRRWRGGGSPDGFSGDDVWSITQTRDGAIWAGTYGAGLNRLDPATGAVLGEIAAFLAFRHPGMDLVDPEALARQLRASPGDDLPWGD